jgi:hypothetical protein
LSGGDAMHQSGPAVCRGNHQRFCTFNLKIVIFTGASPARTGMRSGVLIMNPVGNPAIRSALFSATGAGLFRRGLRFQAQSA